MAALSRMCILFFISVATVSADPIPVTMHSLFQRSFYSYQKHCSGINVLKLVDLARETKMDLTACEVLNIENSAPSGTVHLLAARGEADSFQRRHHAVLVCRGEVFDFDFTNAPTVVSIKEYFSKMFVPEVLARYSITVMPAPFLLDPALRQPEQAFPSVEDYLHEHDRHCGGAL